MNVTNIMLRKKKKAIHNIIHLVGIYIAFKNRPFLRSGPLPGGSLYLLIGPCRTL